MYIYIYIYICIVIWINKQQIDISAYSTHVISKQGHLYNALAANLNFCSSESCLELQTPAKDRGYHAEFDSRWEMCVRVQKGGFTVGTLGH